MAEDYRPDSVVRMPAVGDYRRDLHHDQKRRRYQPPPPPRLHHTLADVASILGLAESAVTEPVRAAITKLMDEVARLRWEVEHHQHRLDWLEHLAHTHSVLPLANRRGLVHDLDDLLLRHAESGLSGVVAVIEVEGMASLRSAGMAAGDAVQHHVAQVLRAVLREHDLAAHMDGDFFVAVLVFADTAAAADKGAEIAGLVNRPPFVWQERTVPLAVHFGLCEFNAAEDAEQALAAADADRIRRREAALSGLPPSREL